MVVYLEVWYAGFRSAKLSTGIGKFMFIVYILTFFCFFISDSSSQGAYPPNAVQDNELAAEVCLRVHNTDMPFS